MMILNRAKYAAIGRRIREIPPEKPDSSYEWEELVERLCLSDDVHLHEIGVKELSKINLRRSDAGQKID